MLLTHGAFIADAAAAIGIGIDFQEGNEVYLSYLPLAHAFERLLLTLLLGAGCAVGFWRGVRLRVHWSLVGPAARRVT